MEMANQTTVVTTINGSAWIRNEDGTLTPIKEGDVITAGAEIVTGEGAELQLAPQQGNPFTVGESQELVLSEGMFDDRPDSSTNSVSPLGDLAAERVIAALDAGEDPFDELDPTAAVLAGGADGAGGSSFTRLLSIIETTSPLALAYPKPAFNPEDPLHFFGGAAGGQELAAGKVSVYAIIIVDYMSTDELGINIIIDDVST